jgi:hypothetical protein
VSRNLSDSCYQAFYSVRSKRRNSGRGGLLCRSRDKLRIRDHATIGRRVSVPSLRVPAWSAFLSHITTDLLGRQGEFNRADAPSRP